MKRESVVVPAPRAGKVSSDLLDRVILPHLGVDRPEVLVGPRHGADAGVIDLGDGQVLAVTTDPFFVMPELGWERAAWFAVQIVASDAATTGLTPAYLTVDLNLPLDMPDADLESLWTGVHDTCRDTGLSVVTGHTGRYDGCSYPMLGGATVMSIGSRKTYVTPSMASPGDAVLLTKGAAIETTGMFGVTFPGVLRSKLGPDLARAAENLFSCMTVVPDAAAAIRAGVRADGVTALHDATERGVYGGLVEIAQAAGAGLVVEQESIPILPESRAVCDLFKIDPYTASSEGTLLIACKAHRARAVIDSLEDAGILAVRVGELTPAEKGLRVVVNGAEHALEAPLDDPFWPAYAAALQEHVR